ncbi:hypothetical protein ABID92_002867 [Frigoribacterium sp. PvP120]
MPLLSPPPQSPHRPLPEPLVGSMIHRSSLVRSGRDDRALRRAAGRGELVRVAPGTYVPAAEWVAASPEQQHALIVRATVARTSSDIVVSHRSALAVHGFPVSSPMPPRVHVIDRSRSATKTTGLMVRHSAALADAEIVDVGGLKVVRPVRAASDVSRLESLRSSVMALDHGLRLGAFDRGSLQAAVERAPRVGRRRALIALDLADALAESPGESLSRVVMVEIGVPLPVLQREFWDRWGLIGRVDFWWPGLGVVGEFDGLTKYLELARRSGRSLDQVKIDEKKREDRIRALPEVRGFARWDWATANDPSRLAAVLADAGVAPVRR